MTESIGINLSGTAAPPSDRGVEAIVALARASEAHARALEASVRLFEGTPGVAGTTTISNCTISMGPTKTTPRKKTKE